LLRVLEVGVLGILVVTLGLLVALGLLWTVYQLEPARFHVRASITKWLSLDIQLQDPVRVETRQSASGAVGVNRLGHRR
jgi:hypothetical protein